MFSPQVYGPGTHEVSYRLQNACDTTYTKDIQVDAVPLTNYTIRNDNETNCEPLTVVFEDASGSPVNNTTWMINDGLVENSNNELEVTFNAGVYYAGMIQDYANGCKDTLEMDLGNGFIEVDKEPSPDFEWEPNPVFANNPNVQFINNSTDGQSYEWRFDSRTASPNFSLEFSPRVVYNAPDGDTTDVCLTVFNGSCATDTCKELIIMNNLTVFMANAFTPNDDGLNDVFFPGGKFHDNSMGDEEYQFLVFNRWGELIFESNTPYEGWNGTHQSTGESVQQDVYVWRLEVYNPESRQQETHIGHITLVR